MPGERVPAMTKRHVVLLIGLLALAGCSTLSMGPDPRSTVLIARGEDIFFRETFGGNGRTCSTCHRAERNFMIDAAFIATLPENDPLFVAERRPALRVGFDRCDPMMDDAGFVGI